MHSTRIQNLVRLLHKAPSTDSIYMQSRHSGRVFLANPDEVTRICDEFDKIPDKYAFFERIFLHLFKVEDIELAVHFQLENLKEEELKKDQKFRTHVGKFQRFMTSLMDMLGKGGLENSDQIVQILRAIGRQHANVRSMSFTAEKWLLFKNVLISQLCKVTDKSYSTWSRLLGFVIFEIKDSYLEHVRHARSSSCPAIKEFRVFRRSQYRKSSVCSAKMDKNLKEMK
ncbi:unnamed protein product [Auanema sp. JU1783]|nr:unnamed protein product [Auanema sp. JU1783]